MTTAAPVPSQRWSVGWWAFIVFIFALQVGLIFWLSDRTPLRPRKPNTAPTLALAVAECEEWLKLTDPTLFALPHAESFSGPAWLHVTPRRMPFFEWDEEPHWLKLAPTNLMASLPNPHIKPDPADWQTPAFAPAAMLPELNRRSLITASHLRIEGDLVARELLTPMDLPSWPALAVTPTDWELLRNTVVQVVVDARGNPVSATLIEQSGHGPADQFALTRAVAARFTPLPGAESKSGVSNLTWGRLVFEWQTTAPSNVP